MRHTREYKQLMRQVGLINGTVLYYHEFNDTITIRSSPCDVGILDALICLLDRHPVKGLVMEPQVTGSRPRYDEDQFNQRILRIFERHGSSTLEHVSFVNLRLSTSFLIAVDQATKNGPTRLKSIDLKGNDFYEGDPSIPLCSILSRCPQLEQLNLGNYNLGSGLAGQEHIFTNFIHTLIHYCPLIRILESDASFDRDPFKSALFHLAYYPETLLQFSQDLRKPDQPILSNYPNGDRYQISSLLQKQEELSRFIQSTHSIANDVGALVDFIHDMDNLRRLIRDTNIEQLKTPNYYYSDQAIEAAMHSTSLKEMEMIEVSQTPKRMSVVCAFIRTCKVKRCGFKWPYLGDQARVQLCNAFCETTGLKEVKFSLNFKCCDPFVQTLTEAMGHRTHQQEKLFTLRKIDFNRPYPGNLPILGRLDNVLKMLRVQDVILALIEPRQIDRVGQQSGMRLISVDIIRRLDGYLR